LGKPSKNRIPLILSLLSSVLEIQISKNFSVDASLSNANAKEQEDSKKRQQA
jgi:hypothetical protein